MGDVTMVDRNGETYLVPEESVARGKEKGWTVEGEAAAQSRLTSEANTEKYEGVGNTVDAYAQAAWRGASGGLTDVAAVALGGEDERARLQGLKEAHPVADLAGSVVGSVTGVGAAAGKLGAQVAKTAIGGASLGAKVGRSALGAGAEGLIEGVGQTISNVALSEEPLSVEQIGSQLSSNVLLSGGLSAGVGAFGKLAEKGLLKAKSAMDDIAKRGTSAAPAGAIDDDIAQIAARDGAKGLKAAEKVEIDAIKAARVPEQTKFVDDLKAHRQSLTDEKIWLATKDLDAKAVGNVKEIGKISFDADKSIRSMLNNPKNLAENPRRALEALQRQENALEMLAKNDEGLRKVFAADASGTRAAALDALPRAMERNRTLQAKVREFMAPPSSSRLDSIEAARAGNGPEAPKSIGEQMLSGAAYSGASGLAYESGIPGASILAPLLGAKAAGLVGSKVFGRLGKGVAEAASRASKGVGVFLDVARKVAPAAPVLASKVLASVRYSQGLEDKKAAKAGKVKRPALAESYKARSAELRAQTAYGPTGAPVMRQEARMAMASRLDPIRTMQPILADRLETLAARRVEFLASKLPRRPDLAGIQAGPDRWQPSDMEMRTFARYAAAVEDPHAIVDRLADGSITPEDSEAMRTVYPEMFADIQRQIIEKLPELQESLPYERRLALSIFSDVPVDPSCDPRVLEVLQQSFVEEPGSEGGTQAPMPEAAFGSVKNQEATASQRREGIA